MTLGVTDQREILSSLVNADLTLKTSRVGYICWDRAIDLKKPLHADLLYLVSC